MTDSKAKSGGYEKSQFYLNENQKFEAAKSREPSTLIGEPSPWKKATAKIKAIGKFRAIKKIETCDMTEINKKLSEFEHRVKQNRKSEARPEKLRKATEAEEIKEAGEEGRGELNSERNLIKLEEGKQGGGIYHNSKRLIDC
jgi:hypothetical protein